MKRFFSILVAGLLVAGLLAGCGAQQETGMYKDGEYYAKGDPDEKGNYADIKITVKNGKIDVATWKEYSKGGKEKDDTYGKGGTDENYNKAQSALSASRSYGSILQSVQDPNKVDAISGATNSNKLFKQLANKAMETAKK